MFNRLIIDHDIIILHIADVVQETNLLALWSAIQISSLNLTYI